MPLYNTFLFRLSLMYVYVRSSSFGYAEGHYLIFWPEEKSVTVVSGQSIVSPISLSARTVGADCTVRSTGKVYSGRIAGRGKLEQIKIMDSCFMYVHVHVHIICCRN